jgi:nucleoside-diphosphate-sugar epimerase
MRIAVTGGSGKIGSVVCRELVARGHDVLNLDRKPPRAGTAAEEATGTFVEVALARRERVRQLLDGVEAVAHLGEIPNVSVGPSPDEVYAENTRVGATVMQAAADLKVRRVIYTSSAQVYGMWGGTFATPTHLPFDETHPIRPHNAYAAAKAANEVYARLVAEQHGLSVAVFRLPWVHFGDTLEPMATTLKEKPTRTDGFATYVQVADVARAYALALERPPRSGFEVFHFSAAEVMSLYPLRQRLREHHPGFPPLPADWPPFRSPVLTAKAKEHLGWEPKWNFLDLYRREYGDPSNQ